jgi:uncharacterized protein YbjT (DUF2867 family)
MRVAVAGGTGTVGRHVVRALESSGHSAVVLARSQGVDVTTGAGLDDALAGADAVIDVSNTSTLSRRASITFFGTATAHLLEAGERAGVRHHVALSIVGIDGVDYPYYAGKRHQEALVAAGPVPWSVLRATQFLQFPAQVLALSPGPLAVVPVMRIQPVGAAEVAAELVRIATCDPLGRAPDLAGPQVHLLPDLARRVLRARGQRRLVVPLRYPGAAGRAMRSGGLLPDAGATIGTQTFDAWLATDEGPVSSC